jgi:hypothetical protein
MGQTLPQRAASRISHGVKRQVGAEGSRGQQDDGRKTAAGRAGQTLIGRGSLKPGFSCAGERSRIAGKEISGVLWATIRTAGISLARSAS